MTSDQARTMESIKAVVTSAEAQMREWPDFGTKTSAPQYLKLVASLRLRCPGSIAEMMNARPCCKKSWYRRRAAFLHVLRREILATTDNAYWALDQDQNALATSSAIQLKIALAQLAALEAMTCPFGRHHPSASKRRVLSKVRWASEFDDWRDEAFAGVNDDDPHKPALALLILAGLRPAEICLPVNLNWAGDILTIRAMGAKHRGDGIHGQRWKEIDTRADSAPAIYLRRITNEGRVAVKFRSAHALTEWTRRLSRRLWPDLPSAATCYAYRHALSADAKAAGQSTEQIAAALGHCSARTQQQYGMLRQSKGKYAPVSARASYLVNRLADAGLSAKLQVRLGIGDEPTFKM